MQHRITFRLGEKEQQRLDALLAKSTCTTHSELIRKMLFKGKVTLISRDDSMDKIMEQLSFIRTELRRVGVNINQLTASFHAETLPEKRVLLAMEVQRQYGEVGKKVDELLKVIAEISYKWLPG